MCAVGTVQVGYAISNMEPVFLVKLGAPGVTTTAGWAVPREVVRHHLILLEARPTVILNKIPKHVANIQGICKDTLNIGLAVWVIFSKKDLTASRIGRCGF